jgi:hypothetical protein
METDEEVVLAIEGALDDGEGKMSRAAFERNGLRLLGPSPCPGDADALIHNWVMRDGVHACSACGLTSAEYNQSLRAKVGVTDA